MSENIDNLTRIFNTLKLGEPYWQRGYIENQQRTLKTLRDNQYTWVGELENRLRMDIDNYLNSIDQKTLNN